MKGADVEVGARGAATALCLPVQGRLDAMRIRCFRLPAQKLYFYRTFDKIFSLGIESRSAKQTLSHLVLLSMLDETNGSCTLPPAINFCLPHVRNSVKTIRLRRPSSEAGVECILYRDEERRRQGDVPRSHCRRCSAYQFWRRRVSASARLVITSSLASNYEHSVFGSISAAT